MQTKTRRTSSRGVLDFKGYDYVAAQSKPQRTAHALYWAREKFPMQLVAVNVLCKAINGYKQMPRLGTKEVEDLRNTLGRVRKILHETYGCGLHVVPGLGIRATVDDADQLKMLSSPDFLRKLEAPKSEDESDK